MLIFLARLSFSIFILIFISAELCAQDTHYWSQTYGTRSTLLGGTVIGSVDDLGATYYNPGNLALIDNPNFLFSAKIFEYHSFSVEPKDYSSDGISKQSFRPSPSFIVANLTGEWLGDNRIGFSFLTRQSMDIRLKARLIEEVNNTDVSNEFIFEEDMVDYWIGITWSYPFQDKLGIGVTQYFAIKNYRSRQEANVSVLSSNNNLLSTVAINEYDYYNVRILWKAGIGFSFEKIKFGLTVTTPSINLFGVGETDLNIVRNSPDANENLLISDFQKDLSTDYNSATSFGFGAYYKFEDLKIHFAAEYFTKVSLFNVIESEEFQSQSGNVILQNNLFSAADPVLNYGLGFEYFISQMFTAYGAFTVDFSSYPSDVRINHSFSKYNLYHLTIGSSLNIKKIEITFGTALSFGNDEVTIPVVPIIPLEKLDRIIDNQAAELNTFRLKLILGLTF